ncbi:MAG TPA: hypothetical protein VK157_05080 [Phycisphaerales bacterium]|nr:hypothetical protein [Phycisphaerales bacterium]
MACHRYAAFGEPVNIGAAGLGTCSNGWGTYAELDLNCNNDGVETAGDAAALASGTAYSCGVVLWDTANFNRDGQVNTDDVTAFTAA